MDENNTLTKINHYLNKANVMAMSFIGPTDFWCANFFYAYDAKALLFYVISDSDTRHGAMMQPLAKVVGSVTHQPKTMVIIQGIQFAGTLIPLIANDDKKQAKAFYNARYPLAKLASTPVWKIRIDELKMTDNTLGMGKKLVWLRR